MRAVDWACLRGEPWQRRTRAQPAVAQNWAATVTGATVARDFCFLARVTHHTVARALRTDVNGVENSRAAPSATPRHRSAASARASAKGDFTGLPPNDSENRPAQARRARTARCDMTPRSGSTRRAQSDAQRAVARRRTPGAYTRLSLPPPLTLHHQTQCPRLDPDAPYWVRPLHFGRTGADARRATPACSRPRWPALSPSTRLPQHSNPVRGADGVGITVSYWRDEASIAAWKRQAARHPSQQTATP